MDLEVRTIRPEEAEDLLGVQRTSFLGAPPAEGYAEWWVATADLDRTWAAFDGERLVGSLRSFATPLTVPGPATLPAAALTMVAVLPTHHRRGLLERMLTADLRNAKDRGEVAGILLASEWPIYGRYGYGVTCEAASYHVRTREARFADEVPGSMAFVDAETLAGIGPELHRAHRLARPGAIERTTRWWERNLGRVEVPGAENKHAFQAVYSDAGGTPAGYVRYRGRLEWATWSADGVVTIEDLVATTAEAYAALWRFCCELDLVVELRAVRRPVDEPLPLLLEDGRAVVQHDRHDFLWLRVLDVPAALEARRYGSDGSLVVEVHDRLGFATGTYRLEVAGGAATCSASSDPADLVLGVGALGSLYLGGIPARSLQVARLIEESRPGAVERAAAMFHATLAPWCDTDF